MTDLALAIAHHLLVFSVAGVLAAELASVRVGLTEKGLRRLAMIDAHFGLFAGLVLAVGFARVFYGIKGPDAYLGNPYFWAKVGAFLLAGVISIQPTVRFIRWRRASKADPGFSPAEADVLKVRRFLLAETGVFALIPVLAAVMARYGY